MEDRPSRAAVLVRGYNPEHLEPVLDAAMSRKRYARHDAPLPAGYRAGDGEWLGFVLTRSDDLRVGVIVPEDVSRVFHVAMWLGQRLPDVPLVGWQRMRGLPGVMKLYAGGKPLYKVGQDHDLEVDWAVPTTPPVNIVTAEEAGYAATPDAVEDAIGSALRPYGEQQGRLGPHDRVAAYLRRGSPLL